MKNAIKIGGGTAALLILAKAISGKKSGAKKGASNALAQLKRYKGIKEDDSRFHKILMTMWMHLGYSKEKAERYIRNEIPWSAAMISYNMRDYEDFPKSASHAYYAVASRKNRAKGESNFWLYRPHEIRPKVGDIVLKGRSGARVNYDSVKVGDPTHGDIVVEVQKDYLITIGGNVSNQVKITKVAIKNGYISDPKYFAIIQNRHKK
ncbi:MAG: hypothetical protein ACI8ZM_002468 [Crocinitomix sp.]